MEGFHVLMYHDMIRRADYDENNASWIRIKQDYHDVLPGALFVFLEEFEKQMGYLHENRFNVLRLRDVIDFFYNGKSIPEKSILITFDDMFKSALLYAHPVLKKYGFPAVGFVALEWLFDEAQRYDSRESVCLSRGELEEMRDVFEFANHSAALHTRKDGLTALQIADRAGFMADAGACSRFVDAKDVYAYPFGMFTDNIIKWLKEMGFKLAFATTPGLNTRDTDPFRLNRDTVLLSHDISRFAEIVNA